ncbi:hypothetical protein DPEC_G00084920 [Dallia pectoralis]|uniref:Uncharacterized protein n=1 Tax=Dallia pectoralis TaxID=75939 RepID=A0ACC2GZW4_DALPE|nr:hypothetical protein DPEC_G00084920 [Dallia pectoralis]
MTEHISEPEDDLICGLAGLNTMGRILLENAKQEAAGSIKDFVPNKITTLFGLMTCGANFYKSISVKTQKEAEDLWKKSYHHAKVRDQVDELLQLEKEWDAFLDSIDTELKNTDKQLMGHASLKNLGADTLLTDARSGENVALGKYFGKGESLLLVLIRHFG